MYKQDQFQSNGKRSDYKTLKTKELWKENEAKKKIEDLIKRKMKEETRLRDKHFIVIYINIIIVIIIIISSSSNDDTDDGEWVEFGNTCWY